MAGRFLSLLALLLGAVFGYGAAWGLAAGLQPSAAPLAAGVQQVAVNMRDFRFASPRYHPADLSVRPGRLVVTIRNDDIEAHDFTIPALHVTSGMIAPGSERNLDFAVPTGIFPILCTHPLHGHEVSGPVGYLVVGTDLRH